MSLLGHSASAIRLKAILQGGPLSRGQTTDREQEQEAHLQRCRVQALTTNLGE